MVCTHIEVVSATYANNCGKPVQLNNVDENCDGKASCAYDFVYFVDPGFDPAPGCPKDLNVIYECVDGMAVSHGSKSAYVPPEALHVELECGCY